MPRYQGLRFSERSRDVSIHASEGRGGKVVLVINITIVIIIVIIFFDSRSSGGV
jgi:hypothetical protein